jgi:sulfatase modifying factor 1
MKRTTTLCGLAITLLTSAALLPQAHAVTITHGTDSVDIDFVDIGNVNNTTADTSGYGVVSYEYSIGTYEVTAAQWLIVTTADTNVGNAGAWSGLQPTARSSWYEAAKFANWLTSGDALAGAYTFRDSITYTGVDRATALTNYQTIYVLPTEDEWYKAAYFKSDGSGYTTYPTGNSVPDGLDSSGDTIYDSVFNDGFTPLAPLAVGGGTMENNGTYDMGGNLWEWNESYVIRGGLYEGGSERLQGPSRYTNQPGTENDALGFRVASISVVPISVVPEPSSVGLLVIGAMGCMLRRKRG